MFKILTLRRSLLLEARLREDIYVDWRGKHGDMFPWHVVRL